MKRLVKKVLIVLTRPYFWLRTRYFVWHAILNRESVSVLQKNAQALDHVGIRIAKDIAQYGIATTTLTELGDDMGALKQLQEFAESLKSGATVRKGKPFLKMLWPDDMEITLKNPFIAYTLSEKVLSIVGAYLGSAPKYFYSSLDITTPVSKDAPGFRSQNWHRDPEDLRMCKMFIYLTDVDEGAGPFVYVRGSQYGGPYAHIYPQRPPKGSYPPEGRVESLIPRERYQVCSAPAGTVIFADTAGLHRGGYATVNERLMFTAEFSSKASLRPPHYRYAKSFFEEQKALGPLGQYASDTNFGVAMKVTNAISNIALRYGLHDSGY